MWNERFHQFMLKIKFQRSSSDYCLYIYFENSVVCYILLYVDDLLIISNHLKMIDKVKNLFSSEFDMTDIGEVKTFLGIHIERDRSIGTLCMSQSRYLKGVLCKFGMENCKPVHTPMESGLCLQKGHISQPNVPYRELIGCLTYATLTTRPDLCASTNFFSRFQGSYTDEHYTFAKRVLRYIQGTLNLKMVYHRNPEADVLVGYADADWANDRLDRKSISGYVFKVYGNTISWSSRKQATVSLSSTEAEYIALAQGSCEAMWLRNLLQDLKVKCDGPTILYEDNQSCIRVAEEPREHKRMKHIDVKYNFIRDAIVTKCVDVRYTPSEMQLADIMTKPLGRNLFEKHRKNLSLS